MIYSLEENWYCIDFNGTRAMCTSNMLLLNEKNGKDICFI